MIGPLSHLPKTVLPGLPDPQAYRSAVEPRKTGDKPAKLSIGRNLTAASVPAQIESAKVAVSESKADSMERNTLAYYKALHSSNATAKLLRHLERK